MSERKQGASVLLRPAGPLDADTCGHLRYQLAAAFAAGVSSVVVDLSDVSSLDLVGLGVLTGAARHLKRRNGTLVVAHPVPEVLTTMRSYDVERLLEVQRSTPVPAGQAAQSLPPRRLRSVPDETEPGEELAQPG